MGKAWVCSPAAGAAAVSVFVGSGTAAAVGVSVLVPFVAGLSEAFSLSFLKRDLTLSILAGLGWAGVRRS
jgi:hypothetical protein